MCVYFGLRSNYIFLNCIIVLLNELPSCYSSFAWLNILCSYSVKIELVQNWPCLCEHWSFSGFSTFQVVVGKLRNLVLFSRVPFGDPCIPMPSPKTCETLWNFAYCGLLAVTFCSFLSLGCTGVWVKEIKYIRRRSVHLHSFLDPESPISCCHSTSLMTKHIYFNMFYPIS